MQGKSRAAGLAQRMAMRQVEKTMSRDQAVDQGGQQHAEAVRTFLQGKGHLVCVCEDSRVLTLVRSTICETLGVPAAKLTVAHDAEMVVRLVRNVCVEDVTPLLLSDASVSGRSLSYVMRLLKNGFPELRIALFTSETDAEHLAMLQEAGATGGFPRPTDGKELLERISSCVATYGKIDRMIDWARTLLEQGEHLSALQVCKKALDAKNNSSAVLLMIGDIFRAMGQMEKACEAYENANRVTSTDLEPLRRLADLYRDTNNPRKRLACLERLDQLAPYSVERKLAIGELYLTLHDAEQAKKIFNQGLELASREAMAQVGGVAFRVAEAVAETDINMAIAYWRKGFTAKHGMLIPDDLHALNRLGMTLRRKGRWKEACEEYQKALEAMPHNETLFYNMAMAYVDGKDFESARAAILKALAINPDLPRKSASAALNMAAVFMEVGDNMHAMPLLRTTLEIEPENQHAQEMLAKLEAAAG